MDWKPHIEDAGSATGPLLRGTSVPVGRVLDLLAGGWSAERIVQEYPGVTEVAVRACLAYAADEMERIRFVAAIDKAMRDVDEGRTIPHEEVVRRLEEKYGPLDRDLEGDDE